MTNPSQEPLKPYQTRSHLSHGHTVGRKCTPTYRSWQAMIGRCKYLRRDNASRYKDKGVTVCDRWKIFENFLNDMGVRPIGKSLDRIDSNGHYCPENCRWATPCEQARNTRRNVLTIETAIQVAVLRLKGVKCKELSLRFGISESLPREIVKGRTWKDALDLALKQIKEEENGNP